MWASLSGWVDELALTLGKVFDPPAFREGPAGPPPELEDLVAEQRAHPPAVRWPARLERRVGRLRLTMPAIGVETFADFHPAAATAGPFSSAVGNGADTLFVYHHGLGEFPHDGSAAMILGRPGIRERVDWIAIKGPHHEMPSAVALHLLRSEGSFVRGLFSSVFAARAIAEHLRPQYRYLVLGGISMGGVISLIEGAVGSLFDLHVPILAGPDLGSVLLDSSFTRVVSKAYLKTGAARNLPERLNLASYLRSRDGPPIRAVLATYDRLFRLDPQLGGYARIPRAEVKVVSGGHITGALRFRAVGAIVAAALERELWSRPQAPAAAAAVPAPAAQAAAAAA